MLDKGKDKSKIDKYIRLLYGKDSELNHILELNERKKTACLKAGLDPKEPASQAIMDLKNDKVNDQIFEFMRQNNPLEHIQLISDTQLFFEILKRKMQPLDDDLDDDVMLKNINLKTTMSQKSEELLDRIKRLHKEIYQTSAEIEMAEGKIRKMISPEARVKQKQA